MKENVRVYFCPGSSEEMGHFRETSTKAMRLWEENRRKSQLINEKPINEKPKKENRKEKQEEIP